MTLLSNYCQLIKTERERASVKQGCVVTSGKLTVEKSTGHGGGVPPPPPPQACDEAMISPLTFCHADLAHCSHSLSMKTGQYSLFQKLSEGRADW